MALYFPHIRSIVSEGTSKYIPECIRGVLYQKQVWRTGANNCTPHILWGVITCPCTWYLLLAQHYSYRCCILSNVNINLDLYFLSGNTLGKVWIQISWFRDFTCSCGKTSLWWIEALACLYLPCAMSIKSLVSMMTSSNGNIFRVTGPSCGEFTGHRWIPLTPVTGEFPSQMPVTRSYDVFFDLRLNKRLSKQSRRWWFEKPSRSLWRHC